MLAITEWAIAWEGLGLAEPPGGLLDRLVASYGEAERHYHNLRHLDECFGHLDSLRSSLQGPAEVALALWFHDAVYDPRRADNEARSAAWAEQALRDAGRSDSTVEAVRALILATAHRDQPGLADQRALVDVDLAILAAERPRFDEYEAEVRLEYAWVPEEQFRAGRAGVLRHFLSRPSLYATESFRDRFEARARENIGRSLRRLEG